MTLSEWVCRACEHTECHFTVNAKLKRIFPVRCPLSGLLNLLLKNGREVVMP